MELVRAAVLEVYAAIRQEDQLADRVLDRVLRRERRLHSSERRAISEAVYGMLRHERRLDFALFSGRPPPPGLASSALHNLRLAAWTVLDGADPAVAAQTHALPADASASLARVLDPLPDSLPPATRVAIEGSLPDFLGERLIADLGLEDALGFVRALALRGPLTLRTNTLETSRDALARRLLAEGAESTPTLHSPLGLTLTTRVNAFGLRAFADGLFEVQDEGSQLLAMLVGARPGEKVIDACAGIGGKTLALAADMGNTGELWALDVDPRRLDELAQRARRAGVHNIRRLTVPAEVDPEPAAAARLARADRVLVDAPCTGLGALRRNPDARYRFQPEDFARHAARQLAILRRFAAFARIGGRVVYATCSVAREENEAVVEAFLAADPSFRIVPVTGLLGEERAGLAEGPFLRAYPHKHQTDGFFAAVLERIG